jgi:hypothetical protein
MTYVTCSIANLCTIMSEVLNFNFFHGLNFLYCITLCFTFLYVSLDRLFLESFLTIFVFFFDIGLLLTCVAYVR